MNELNPEVNAANAFIQGQQSSAAAGFQHPGQGASLPNYGPDVSKVSAQIAAGHQRALDAMSGMLGGQQQQPQEPTVVYDGNNLVGQKGTLYSLDNLSAADQGITSGDVVYNGGQVPNGARVVPLSMIRGYMNQQSQQRGVGHAVGDFLTNIPHGIRDVAAMVPRSIAAMAPSGGAVNQAYNEWADVVKGSNNPNNQPDVYGYGPVASTVMEAGRVVPMAGLGVLSNAIPGGGAVTGAMFGLSGYEEGLHEAKARGLDGVEQQKYAGINGAIQAGLGLAVGPGVSLLRPAAITAKTVPEAVGQATTAAWGAQAAKGAGAKLAGDAAVFGAQDVATQANRNSSFDENGSLLEAGAKGILTGAVLGAFHAPGEMLHARAEAGARQMVGRAINDYQNEFNLLDATEYVKQQITPTVGEQPARDWADSNVERMRRLQMLQERSDAMQRQQASIPEPTAYTPVPQPPAIAQATQPSVQGPIAESAEDRFHRQLQEQNAWREKNIPSGTDYNPETRTINPNVPVETRAPTDSGGGGESVAPSINTSANGALSKRPKNLPKDRKAAEQPSVKDDTSEPTVQRLTPEETLRRQGLIEAASKDIDHEPTDAEKEAGNYQKGHVPADATNLGIEITLENRRGSTRSGTAPDGTTWETKMAHHYGYLLGTVGKDKDHIDIFLTPGAESATHVFIVDQKNDKGGFDEHKVILGPRSKEQARKAYLDNYEPGWDKLGSITKMSIAEFRKWAQDQAATKKPADTETKLKAVEKAVEARKNVPEDLAAIPRKDTKSLVSWVVKNRPDIAVAADGTYAHSNIAEFLGEATGRDIKKGSVEYALKQLSKDDPTFGTRKETPEAPENLSFAEEAAREVGADQPTLGSGETVSIAQAAEAGLRPTGGVKGAKKESKLVQMDPEEEARAARDEAITDGKSAEDADKAAAAAVKRAEANNKKYDKQEAERQKAEIAETKKKSDELAAQEKPKAEATPEEKMADAKQRWEKVYPDVKWENTKGEDEAADGLGEFQRKQVVRLISRFGNPDGIDFDPKRLNTEMEKIAEDVKNGTSYSDKSEGVSGEGSKAADVKASLRRAFFSPDKFNQLVTIVQSAKDLPKFVQDAVKIGKTTQAFVHKGKVYMLADHIDKGQELGVLLHELGVHVGMESLLGKENMVRLAKQIADWSEGKRGLESKIAQAAMKRLEAAQKLAEERGEPFEDADYMHEMIAYFVEEAVKHGVNPTAAEKSSGALGAWFRTLWAAAKAALRKVGLGRFEDLTAQHVVDLTYGAADLEFRGGWHGTAAEFRKFNHDYMGTGEGAQAYGWGTYLAQRPGIAHEYWKADVKRKEIERLPTVDGKVPDGYTAINAAEFALLPPSYVTGTKEEKIQYAIDNAKKHGYSPVDVESLRQALGLIKSGAKLGWQESSSPEGSLMRVSHAVHDDEMLDWDKPLSEQNKVRIALMPLRKFLAHTADELTGGANWNDMTGEEMYHLVQRALQQDYFDPNLPKVDEALRQGKTDQAASEYLDSIGIKGIRFLDSQSRSPLPDVKFVGNDNLGRNRYLKDFIVYMRRTNGDFAAAVQLMRDKFDVPVGSPKRDIVSTAVSNFLSFVKQSDFEVTQPSQTRNLVIFNDKNLVRVMSEVGAKRDADSIRFSDQSEKHIAEMSHAAFAHLYANATGDLADIKTVMDRKYIPAAERIRMMSDAILTKRDLEQKVRFSEKAEEVRETWKPDRVAKITENLPKPLRDAAVKTVEWLSNVGEKWRTGLFLGDLVDFAEKHLPSSRALYEAKLGQTAVAARLLDPINQHKYHYGKLSKEDRVKADRMIDDMDGRGWAYDPGWYPKAPELDEGLKAKYDALKKDSPEAAKVVKEHFQLYHDLMGAVKRGIYTDMKEALREAQESGDEKRIAAAQRAYERGLKDADEQFKELSLPYSHRSREGDWFAVAKSKEFNDLQERINDPNGEATAADRKQLAEMEKLPEHKLVSKGTRGDMRLRAEELTRTGKYETVNYFPMEPDVHGKELPLQQLRRLKAAIKGADNEEIDGKTRNAALSSVEALYIRSLSDLSGKTAQLHRREISGYEGDYRNGNSGSRVAASVHHMEGMAHLAALLENVGGVHDAIQRIRSEAHNGYYYDADGKKHMIEGSDIKTRKAYANELILRHALNMIHMDTRWQSKWMQFTAGMRIVTSPAFYLQQLSEPWMVVQPYIASRHGEYNSGRAMTAAMADAFKLVGKGGEGVMYDVKNHRGVNDATTAREQELLRYLTGRGRLDLSAMSNVFGDSNIGTRLFQQTFGRFIRISTQSEAVNRITASLASHRLEFDRLMHKYGATMEQEAAVAKAHQEAMRYADNVVRMTHGEFESFSAPRFMMPQNYNGVPIRMMTQFKKFWIKEVSLLARMTHDAFKGASPEERAMGRAMLKYTFLHYGAVTGIMGLPGYGVVSTIIDWLFKDKNKPLDPDTHLYELLKTHAGKEMAELLVHGVPGAMGVPLTDRIGAGAMMTVVPLSKMDISDRGRMEDMLTTFLGPAVGLASDAQGAYQKFRQGDYYKGTEQLMPTLLRNAMKVYRQNGAPGTESFGGLTNSKNDVLMRPEDMTFLDKNLALLGFGTERMELHNMLQEHMYATQGYYKLREERLKHEYAKAYRENDTKTMEGLRKQWGEYQQAQREQGILPTPIGDLYKAPAEQRKREILTTEGIQFKKSTRGAVADLVKP